MDSVAVKSSSVSQALEDVTKAVQADTQGAGQAHFHLLDSIHRLTLAVETPGETWMRHRYEPLRNAALRLSLEAGLLQAINDKNGESITAKDLAKITGYDALLISRIMRLVTYIGYCDEVGESEYAANAVTHLVDSPAMVGGVRHFYDLFFPIAAVLPQYLRETGVHQFPTRPEDPNPFFYSHKIQFWDFLNESTEDRKDFDNLMEGRRKGMTQWYEVYPLATILDSNAKRDPESILVVDVGGNRGHDIANFRQAHPDIPGRLILQDLPPMIDRVSKEHPKGIELMAYDFFTPQPVKGAHVYYFHNICHDWSDAHCKTILTHTAKSMDKEHSRILLDEIVLPNTGASLAGPSMDFLMMMYTSGMQRSMKQWEILLEACNLEIVKVWEGSGLEQVIECQLKS